MTIEISKSYPFRSIAAKYDLPYWAVLCYADIQAKGTFNYWEKEAYILINKNCNVLGSFVSDIIDALRTHGRIK